jgi:HlyD family type I secretion membrane fusion protein
MPPVPSLFRRAPNPLALFRRRDEDLLAGPISAFESETQAVIVRTTPYSEHMILHVLAGMVLLTIVLMSVVKLDRVVTSAGRVIPMRGNLFVQPLDRSIVKEIRVKTGQIVKKGQVLAELDPTFAQADVDQYRQHLALATAQVARLEAEQAGKPYAPGPSKAEQLQYSIWLPRQQELKQTIGGYDAQIQSAQATILKAQRDIVYYTQHSNIASKLANMDSTLEERGYGSKLKSLMSQDSRVEMERLLEEARNTLTGAQHDLENLKAQRQVAIGKWNDDIGTQLATARDDVSQTQQALTKAQKTSELISLQAPEDAVVLDIGQVSPGAIVDLNTPGSVKPMFTLTPLNGPLEAEVDITSDDIGFIQEGDPVQLKIDAYPYLRHGTMKGKILNISEGSFTLDENNTPVPAYFKARVSIDSSDLFNVPANFRLIPGMTIQGDVLVGHRTVLSYLVEGGMRNASEAMREP